MMNPLFFLQEKIFLKNLLILILFTIFFWLNCKNSEERPAEWFNEKEKAFKTAQTENKKILIFFQKTICMECDDLKKKFDRDELIQKNQKKFIFLTITENNPDFEQFLIDDRYSELKKRNYFFVILNFSEEILFKTEKFDILSNSLEKL